MATAEIQIVPVGTATPSIGDYLADAVKAAKAKGIDPIVGPTGTYLEGDVPRLLEVARAMHEATFAHGAERVMTTLVIDDRRDKETSVREMVLSVEAKVEGESAGARPRRAPARR